MQHLYRVNLRLCMPRNIVYQAIFNENINRHIILCSMFFPLIALKVEFHFFFFLHLVLLLTSLTTSSCEIHAFPLEHNTYRGPLSLLLDWASRITHVISYVGQSFALKQTPPHMFYTYLDFNWVLYCFRLLECESLSMSKQAPVREIDGQSLLIQCQETEDVQFTCKARVYMLTEKES